MKIIVHKSWKKFFIKHKKDIKNIFKQINFNNHILPPKKLIFRTFQLFPYTKCKLVILGQDPYPGFEKKTGIYYAEGLSFSVNPLVKTLPPSLKNIFKELKSNYPDFTYNNGSLIKWTQQHVMLLNTSLTVEKGKPNIHSKLWEQFTNNVIKELDTFTNCIFLLMGGNAKKKIKIIQNKNRIITCTHPSPLSAYQGFFNSNIFIQINQKLQEFNFKPIHWNL